MPALCLSDQRSIGRLVVVPPKTTRGPKPGHLFARAVPLDSIRFDRQLIDPLIQRSTRKPMAGQAKGTCASCRVVAPRSICFRCGFGPDWRAVPGGAFVVVVSCTNRNLKTEMGQREEIRTRFRRRASCVLFLFCLSFPSNPIQPATSTTVQTNPIHRTLLQKTSLEIKCRSAAPGAAPGHRRPPARARPAPAYPRPS